MFKSWFGKIDGADVQVSPSEKNNNGNPSVTEHNENVKRMLGPVQVTKSWQERNKLAAPPKTPTFDQIYENATVKPPRLEYGIQKVAEMGASSHLAGMSPASRQKAVLMALEAARTEVGEILKEVVTRQRALKEYEESYQDKVNQFEAGQVEQTRLQQAELDRITGEFNARIKASLDEVAHWQAEFRAWQKSKQQELQRLTDATALCVSRESVEDESDESEPRIMAIPHRATGTYR